MNTLDRTFEATWLEESGTIDSTTYMHIPTSQITTTSTWICNVLEEPEDYSDKPIEASRGRNVAPVLQRKI